MGVGRMLRRIATLVLALALVLAPAKALSGDRLHGPASHARLTGAHPSSALVSTDGGAPDGELRPGDQRDPAPPLPGAAALGLLLAGAATLAILRRARPRRLALPGASSSHAPRAPPALVTI